MIIPGLHEPGRIFFFASVTTTPVIYITGRKVGRELKNSQDAAISKVVELSQESEFGASYYLFRRKPASKRKRKDTLKFSFFERTTKWLELQVLFAGAQRQTINTSKTKGLELASAQ